MSGAEASERGSAAIVAIVHHPSLAFVQAYVPEASRVAASVRAERFGTCPLAELVASEAIGEDALYRALAEGLGMPFAQPRHESVLGPAGRPPPPGARVVRLEGEDGAATCHAPTGDEVVRLARMRARGGDGSLDRMVLTSPARLDRAIRACRSDGAMRDAVHDLSERTPLASARRVATGSQGFGAATLLWGALLFAAIAPLAFSLVLHVVLSVMFAAGVGLRILATREAKPPRYAPLPAVEPAELPVYTVLVALHDEAAVVPQLVAHLDALRWPRTKLDIRLVCEADDRATLEAIAAHGLPPHMKVIRVPGYGPRTKPKALNYALDGALGDLLVLYDAEDRPHRNQLLEAYGAFRDGDDALACLQAPLQIDNGHRSFMARGFALEYAALFRGLLPFLARRGLPIPLGGTSNHFRVDALRQVGAWDPFNVTEDADLGFRLARAGYRTGTIDRPTLEAAPESLAVWLPQRTRWLKGWMQTWLTQMRRPVTLFRALGPAGFAVMQLTMLGMIASALFHPLMLVTVPVFVASLHVGLAPGPFATGLLVLDLVNVVLCYAAFHALATGVLASRERWLARGTWWRLPPYWLALGLAGWRAAWKLWREPHAWEKTPHEPSPPALGGTRRG